MKYQSDEENSLEDEHEGRKKMRVECTACVIKMGERRVENAVNDFCMDTDMVVKHFVCLRKSQEEVGIDCGRCKIKSCKFDLRDREEGIPDCNACKIDVTTEEDATEEGATEEEVIEAVEEEATEDEAVKECKPPAKAVKAKKKRQIDSKAMRPKIKLGFKWFRTDGNRKKKKQKPCCKEKSCKGSIDNDGEIDFKGPHYRGRVPTRIQSAERWLTGYFRDGERRVDLVFVLPQLRACGEALQIKYLMNVLDLGLDLEVESEAVMQQHKNLTFVKVHAPAALLQKYGVYFEMRKFFKTEHMRYTADLTKTEADFIRIARRNYPRPLIYSTIERSAIVYRLLRSPPVGTDSNNYGLDSMLREKMVLDVFALHDGPYFLLPEQIGGTVNARQSLFYSWTGFSNLQKTHPKHLIREYFGERLALVFAFWEALQKFLFTLAVFSIVTIMTAVRSYKSIHSKVNDAACRTEHSYKYKVYSKKGDVIGDRSYGDLPICPKCMDFIACPFRNLTEYCFEVKAENSLDSPTFAGLAMYAILHSWIYFFRWWRREEQYMYLWEVPRDSDRNTTRAQYQFWPDPTFPPVGKNFKTLVLEFVVIILAVFAYLYLATASILWFHYKLLRETAFLDESVDFKGREAVILVSVGIVNAVLGILATPPYRWMANALTALENHRTEHDYELSLMVKRLGFGFLINFSLYYDYGVVKATHNTYPSDPKQLKTWLGGGFLHCGVLGCFYELFIIVVTTGIVQRCFDVVCTMFRRETYEYHCFVKNVPCWEKEYLLKPLEEKEITEIIYELIMKYMRSTLLLVITPMAPLMILITVIWDIRTMAYYLLVCRRRPLLYKFHGLGVWRWWLLLLPLGISLSNALLFAYNTNIFDQMFYQAHFTSKSFFGEYALSYFNTTVSLALIHGILKEVTNNQESNVSNSRHLKTKFIAKKDYEFVNTTGLVAFEYGSYRPEFCMFPGKYEHTFDPLTHKTFGRVVGPVRTNDYHEASASYYIKLQREWLILIFQLIGWVTGGLLWHIFWEEGDPPDTVLSRDFEEKMRTRTLMREKLKKME